MLRECPGAQTEVNAPGRRLKSHCLCVWIAVRRRAVLVSRQKLDSEVCSSQSCRVGDRGRKRVGLEVVLLKRLMRMTIMRTDGVRMTTKGQMQGVSAVMQEE